MPETYYYATGTEVTSIADAIRSKVHISSALIFPDDFVEAIDSIQSITGNYTLQSKGPITPTKSAQTITPDSAYYGLSSVSIAAIPSSYYDVSAVTASAGDVLTSKKFVNSSGTVTNGTMTNNGAVNKTLDATTNNQSYTVPVGYHNGSGTVSITLEEKSVTPSTSAQNITPTSGKVLSKVTVAAIPSSYKDISNVDAIAGDVLSGKVIVTSAGEVTGTMADNGSVSKVLDATTNNQSYTVPAGYHDGTGTVSISLESKNATPSTSSQTITPTSGKVLSSVTIAAIPSQYQDVSNVDAVAEDVIAGKIIATSTGDVTGTMTNNGGVVETLDVRSGHTSYTIAEGYHDGTGSVSIVTETKTVTPSGSSQTITPTAGKVLSSVTVNAIPNGAHDVSAVTATAGDVLATKVIVESDGTVTTGTMPNNGAVSVTLDASSGNQSYTVPIGYHNGSGTVNIILEQKNATPSTTSQTVTPTSGNVLGQVTVDAIPSKYGDTTGDSAVAANLLYGVTAHTIDSGDAVQITGSMPNNGAISGTIDGLTTTSYSIPAGYTSGGSVSLTSDIENALAAI